LKLWRLRARAAIPTPALRPVSLRIFGGSLRPVAAHFDV
jgi:hypothetical protein